MYFPVALVSVQSVVAILWHPAVRCKHQNSASAISLTASTSHCLKVTAMKSDAINCWAGDRQESPGMPVWKRQMAGPELDRQGSARYAVWKRATALLLLLPAKHHCYRPHRWNGLSGAVMVCPIWPWDWNSMFTLRNTIL